MDSERWQNVERLYHAALECEESQRAAFLIRACWATGDSRIVETCDGRLDSDGKKAAGSKRWFAP